MPTHPMVTRAKAGIFKPLERINCHVTTTSPFPRSHIHALLGPNWKEAMLNEYNALITNGMYKARLVANGPSSSTLLQRIIASLHNEFAMKDLGSLNYFLGISVQRSASGLFLSQSKFTEKILERAHMQNCNPCQTPVDTESKLGSDGDPVSDPTLYRNIVVALQYLNFTRPDLSYVVQHVCLYTHDPRDPHFTALKRILCYVRGTLDYGMQLHVSSTTQFSAYNDADWAGCPVTLSRSSVEAEYRGVANVFAETSWIRNLLCELHTPLFIATLVYCDNVSVVYMFANPVQHQRTKHIEIDIHFVRDFVASGQVRVLHVPSRFQLKKGESINARDLETNLYWEFGKFTSRDVLQLQPEWKRFMTLVKQSQELKIVSYYKLYDILKQHQNEVNEIRAERLAHTANPLALVVQQQPVYHPQHHPTPYTQNYSTKSQQAATRNRGKVIVNYPPPIYDQEPTMVTKDDEMSKDKEIDKLMALISLSFKKIYKPTNNNLRTSSNTSRANQDNYPRINRGTGYANQRIVNVAGARENVGTLVVQQSGIQCYYCKEYGHVARECQKPKREKDVAYHKEKMLLCYDVLGFWKAKESTFLVLSHMARDILSVQATSVASELAFSTSGRVLSFRRTRVTPASLKMCMCLKDHLDATEQIQQTSNLENSLDFVAELLEEAVLEHVAIALSDEEVALDEAASEARSRAGSIVPQRGSTDCNTNMLISSGGAVGSPTRWVKSVPIKINVFARKVCLDRLPTRLNLSLRGIDIPSISCPICSSAGESCAHLLFSCRMAKALYSKVARWCEMEIFVFYFYEDWLNWFISLRFSKVFKDMLEVSSFYESPQCNIYLCQICESNSHYGYECSQRVPLVYEPKPCHIQNFSDNNYSHNLPSIDPLVDHNCCYECGHSLNDFFCHHCTCDFCGNGTHVGYNCPTQVSSFQTLPSFPQQYPCCEDCGDLSEAYQIQTPQYTVNHSIFNAHNDLLDSENKLMEQMTYMCEMVDQFNQKKQEEKQIQEDQAANARYWKIPAYYDDDDDHNFAITPNETV
nr:ribonuclease H-like domain-containing protein [Tanacetum cinerariifolium]